MAQATEALDAVTNQLRDLVAAGFRFLPRRGGGELVAVVGIRAHHQVVDVVQVRTETDAVATRMPGSEENLFAPTDVLWQRVGQTSTVLAELLTLPDDHGLPA